jgi:hypothetical protein
MNGRAVPPLSIVFMAQWLINVAQGKYTFYLALRQDEIVGTGIFGVF